MDTLEQNPLKEAGPRPVAHAAKAESGRFTILRAEKDLFLYVPEQQQIYSLPDELARLTRDTALLNKLFRGDDALPVLRDLLARETPALNTSRSAAKGLDSVVLHVAQRCNLDCTYCYAHELNLSNAIMREDVMETCVDRLLDLSLDGLKSIKFLGGEPTLAWAIIEKAVARLEAESDNRGWARPGYVIVTNGTKIDAKKAAFFKRKDFHVLVSVDGDAPIHDHLRPTKGGRGSHSAALAALDCLIEAGCRPAIESVYTRAHFERGITPLDMMEFFMSRGIREFQISLAVGTWHAEDLIEDIEAISDHFVEATRASMRSFRSDAPFLLRGIQFAIDGFFLREKKSHVCGAGRSFAAVNYDGEAFPCYLLESDETSYGYLDARFDAGRIEGVQKKFQCNSKDHHPVCRGCWANEICQSCLGPSFQIDPKISKPPTWFCTFQKAQIGACLAEIGAALKSGDRPVFVRNLERHLAPILSGKQAFSA